MSGAEPNDVHAGSRPVWAPSVGLIRDLEMLALHTWPAAEVVKLDGWQLRCNWGITRRANSVWPNETTQALSLEEKLASVESFYASRQQVARFQICPASQPADLDAELDRRGYTQHAHTVTQVAGVATVLAATCVPTAHRVTVTETLSDAWLTAYSQAECMSHHEAEVRRGILARIEPGTAFAVLSLGGQPVTTGLGVLERGWLGVLCIATALELRRRGAATAILHALADWAGNHGAEQMYLQVMRDNAPARALYDRAGFRPLYEYHYREARSMT